MVGLGCVSKLYRTKASESVTSETSLNRCLGVFDLTVIGVGGMVGSGIYIMAGITAKERTGPSIVLSFLVASVIVILVAACFTELAAQLHKTGSTYLYLYLSVGELPAFIVGFSLLVLGVLGGATNARAWSASVDFLFGGFVSNFTETHLAQWTVGPPIAAYPDILAVVLVILLTVVVACGVQCSANITAVFVIINVLVLVFVTVCGAVYGNATNWALPDCTDANITDALLANSTVALYGNVTSAVAGYIPVCGNGFLAYGWAGVVQGAASCFWAFSGFEMISCAVEESRNPRRDIPIAMSIVMLLVTALYLGASAGLTLLVPYSSIDIKAPFPSAFTAKRLTVGHYIVAIGPLCGFTTALISTTYGFVRTGLAMAEDGLLFSWFGQVNTCSHVPVLPVLFCGLLQAVIAFAFDIRGLIEFSVNLLILSYSAVCVCVIVLRFQQQQQQQQQQHNDGQTESNNITASADSCVSMSVEQVESEYRSPAAAAAAAAAAADDLETDELLVEMQPCLAADDMYNEKASVAAEYKAAEKSKLTPCYQWLPRNKDKSGGQSVNVAVVLLLACMLALSVTVVYWHTALLAANWAALLVAVLATAGILAILACICVHKQTVQHPTGALRLPCVPLIPATAVLLLLILLVSNSTSVGWIGSATILLAAVFQYALYSIHHSKLNVSVSTLNTDSQHLLSDMYADSDDEISTL